MVNELKTLKDLNRELLDNEIDFAELILKKDLKEEAIKDIKALKKVIASGDNRDMPEFNMPFEHVEDWRTHVYSQITYIKWKFNITDEDLKNG